MKRRHARIVGTGHYVPERVVTNDELDRMYPEPVGPWLVENLGIRERHIAAPDEATSDLAAEAAHRALRKSGLHPCKLDMIIVCTDTPDYLSPATASVVQHKIGAVNAGVFDVNCACASFVTGVACGANFIISSPHFRNVLVIGAYAMSKYLNWQDHRTATVFADGAGAVVLQESERPGYLSSIFLADGSYHDYMGLYVGGTCKPATCAAVEKGEHYLTIARRFPPDVNSRNWPKLVRRIVRQEGYKVSDIDFILFTQININTIREVMLKLRLPMKRTHWIVDKWGYTGSACVAMALDDAINLGKGPNPGDLVLLVTSGGGYAMACAALIW